MLENHLESFIEGQLFWLGQSGFKLRSGSGQFLYFDPFKFPVLSEKADLILVSHPHQDHFSPKAIAKLKQQTTVIITPASIAQEELVGLAPGKTLNYGPFQITGVPAYNIDKSFHPKDSNWLGYIVEVDGIRIYHAGDSDFIPEMEDLRPDIALLPVGGVFTMNVKEAVLAAGAIKPKVVIPMHYGLIPGTKGSGAKFGKLWNGATKLLKPLK